MFGGRGGCRDAMGSSERFASRVTGGGIVVGIDKAARAHNGLWTIQVAAERGVRPTGLSTPPSLPNRTRAHSAKNSGGFAALNTTTQSRRCVRWPRLGISQAVRQSGVETRKDRSSESHRPALLERNAFCLPACRLGVGAGARPGGDRAPSVAAVVAQPPTRSRSPGGSAVPAVRASSPQLPLDACRPRGAHSDSL